MNEQTRSPCQYKTDMRRCPEQHRTFVCGTPLYQYCGRYHVLSKADRDRQRGFKTIEQLNSDAERELHGRGV